MRYAVLLLFVSIEGGLSCIEREPGRRALLNRELSLEKKGILSDAAKTSSWTVFRQEILPRQVKARWIVIAHRPTRPLIDSLLSMGISVIRVYAPEHGLFGEAAAGIKVADTVYKGIPVTSLYGSRRAPLPQELHEGDAVLFALREVGVRHYTYLSTLAYTLKAAAEAHRPMYVLDFPNPHAHYAYGPLLDSAYFSFVGLYPTPLVLGLTIGEYARLLVGEGWVPPVELHVVPWRGWKRGMPLPSESPFFTEPPSPALRTPTAVELYPILGWYEAIPSVRIGRGTDTPFEVVGMRNGFRLPRWDTVISGYHLKPITFKPSDESYTYTGWRISRRYLGPIQPDSLFRLGFFLLKTFYAAAPDPATFYQEGFFDRLFGSATLRVLLPLFSPDSLYARFQAPASWERLIQRYRMY